MHPFRRSPVSINKNKSPWEVNDLLTLYLICFGVGLGLTIIVTLFGDLIGHLFDFNIGDPSSHGAGPTPFNATTILSFITVFGGMGYILMQTSPLNGMIIFLIAIAVGLVIAAVLFLFFSKVLLRDDAVMKELDYQLVGTLGSVITPVPEKGIGEMKFVLEGTTRSIGIKSQDGRPLPRGIKVIILSVEKGVATVCEFDEMSTK